MKAVTTLARNRMIIAVLSSGATVLGTALATHYPAIYAAMCV